MKMKQQLGHGTEIHARRTFSGERTWNEKFFPILHIRDARAQLIQVLREEQNLCLKIAATGEDVARTSEGHTSKMLVKMRHTPGTEGRIF